MAHNGSSPRARGTVNRSGRANLDGLVHPRVRGERYLIALVRVVDAGSSPRARGTGRRVGDTHLTERFIPACAGNGVFRAARKQ